MFKLINTGKAVLFALAISTIWATYAYAQEGPPSESPPPPPPPVVQPPPPPVVTAPPPRVQTPPLQLPTVTILNSIVPTDITRFPRPVLNGDPEKTRLRSPESYQFAMTSCQGFSDSDSKYVVFPERGSLFRVVSPTLFELARGKMVVISDTETVKVLTAQAQISVPKGSAAVVEANPQTGATVFSLTGRSSLSMNGKDQPAQEQSFELPAGQTVTIADKDLSAEELISVDGIERKTIEGGIRTIGKAQVFEFSPQQLAGKNMLVACHDLQLYPSSKTARLVRSVEDRVQEEARSQGHSAEEIRSYRPVQSAYAKLAAGLVLTSGSSASTESYRKPVSDDSRFVVAADKTVFHISDNDTIALELGTILLRCDSPVKVQAGESEVRVSRNGVALVSFDGVALKVVNLCDLRRDSIVIARIQETLSVETGREVILTAMPPALPHVFNLHEVGHRELSSRNLGRNGWVTTSEIDIKDLLVKHPLLSAVRKQANSGRFERKLVSQVTKAAAIMTFMHASKEPFQKGVPADEQGAIAQVAGHCTTCQP